MGCLSEVLSKVVERYLKHMLDGEFNIYLLDNDGNILCHRAETDGYLSTDQSMQEILFFNEILSSKHYEPVLIDTKDTDTSLLTAAIHIAASTESKLRCLVTQSNKKASSLELFAFCKIAANLIEDHVKDGEKLRRAHVTVLQQEAIINHISDGLLVLDKHGILQYCNVPAAQLLNINMRTSIGRPISEVLDFTPIINHVFTEGKGYIDREHQIESPSLSLHIIDTALPVRDEKGEIVSVVNTFRRIERVKKLSYKMMMDRPLYSFDDLLGDSDTLKLAISSGQKASKSDTNIVLYGESGTGKELFAQAIHSHGPRSEGPFIAINCAAIPRDLVESELFGYTAGSFTGADTAGRPGKFELASGGTLFLDEIAEMPLEVQVKLLRVLQEKRVLRIGAASSTPIDVRIIAASNVRLKKMVEEGSFREDLFYRLSVIDIEIPALRDRAGDIAILTKQFLDNYCKRAMRPLIELSAHAMDQLTSYSWPGNVRQLQNIIERLVSLSEASVVATIPVTWLTGAPSNNDFIMASNAEDTLLSMKEWERYAIAHTLNSTDFNITKTADILGLSRPTLYAKLKQHSLERR